MSLENPDELTLLIQRQEKGRCWCCWENDDSAANPLVRVCRGCKDLDLQWIHQTCIDTYLSNLPARRIPPSQNQASSSIAVNISDSAGPSNSQVTPNNINSLDWKCTRCNEPYHVIETPLHPIRAIWLDPFLRLALITMIVCISVLTICCVSLIIENWETSNNVIEFVFLGLKFAMRMTVFAFLMLLICHCLNIATIFMMLEFVEGRVNRHVIPIDE